MPIDGQDGRTDGLLEELGDPPVVLGVEGADSDRASENEFWTLPEDLDAPSTTSDGELVFLGTPPNMGRSPVYPEQNEGGLPGDFAGLGVGGLLPDVCIPVLGGGDDAVGVGRPVDGGNEFIVLLTVKKWFSWAAERSGPLKGSRWGSRQHPGACRSGRRWSSS